MYHCGRMFFFFVVALLVLSPVSQAQQSQDEACKLSIYSSGQTIYISGVAFSYPHDLMFKVPGCSDLVVVSYPSSLEPDERDKVPAVNRDDNFIQLEKYLKDASQKKVHVTLSGRLDVAKPIPPGVRNHLGFLFDENGKNVGIYGFGSPAPVYKYRLVLQSVVSVGVGSE